MSQIDWARYVLKVLVCEEKWLKQAMRAEVIIIIHFELYKEEKKKSVEISVYSLHASDDLPLKQWQWLGILWAFFQELPHILQIAFKEISAGGIKESS